MRRGGMGRGAGARRGMRRTSRRRRRRRRRRIILLGGLIAFGAYKMSKKDADRIEQHTGKSADELTDEQLEQAMDQLGIDKQELDDSDNEYLDQVEAKENEAESSGGSSYLDELERLSKLHDDGVITDEEFEGKKKQLLGL